MRYLPKPSSDSQNPTSCDTALLVIVAPEIADKPSLLVHDADVQLYRVDFSAEGGRLLRDQCGAAGADSEQGERGPVERLHGGESTGMAEGTN